MKIWIPCPIWLVTRTAWCGMTYAEDYTPKWPYIARGGWYRDMILVFKLKEFWASPGHHSPKGGHDWRQRGCRLYLFWCILEGAGKVGELGPAFRCYENASLPYASQYKGTSLLRVRKRIDTIRGGYSHGRLHRSGDREYTWEQRICPGSDIVFRWNVVQ